MIDPTITNLDVLNYASNFIVEPSMIFKKIEERAREEKQPVVSKDTGKFLHLLVKLTQAKKILEVGCNIGYSAMWMATALPEDGRLDTIELNKDLALVADEFFQKQSVEEKVFIYVGGGLDIIPNLNGPYDIMFIDAAKKQYKGYLDLALPKIRKGGLILVDNLLWSGRTAQEDTPKEDSMTRSLKDFNSYFCTHPAIDSMILTVGDGIGFGVKK